MYEKLCRDHDELGEIARELRQRIAAPTLTDSAGLGRCRWRLARTITRHLALEDVHVYGRLDADPRPEAVAISRRFKQDLGHLLAHFNAHMTQWTGDAVEQDWPGYCRAVDVLLSALAARIQLEDTQLYPLLARPRPAIAA